MKLLVEREQTIGWLLSPLGFVFEPYDSDLKPDVLHSRSRSELSNVVDEDVVAERVAIFCNALRRRLRDELAEISGNVDERIGSNSRIHSSTRCQYDVLSEVAVLSQERPKHIVTWKPGK